MVELWVEVDVSTIIAKKFTVVVPWTVERDVEVVVPVTSTSKVVAFRTVTLHIRNGVKGD